MQIFHLKQFPLNIIFVLFTQSKISEFEANNKKLKMSQITQLLNVFVSVIIGHIYQIIVEIIKYVMNLFSQQIKLIDTASNPIELMITIVSISKQIIVCINCNATSKRFIIIDTKTFKCYLTREYTLTFFDDSVETGLLELIEFRPNVTILKQYQIGFLFMIIVFVVGDVKASETELIFVIIDRGYNVYFFLSQIKQAINVVVVLNGANTNLCNTSSLQDIQQGFRIDCLIMTQNQQYSNLIFCVIISTSQTSFFC